MTKGKRAEPDQRNVTCEETVDIGATADTAVIGELQLERHEVLEPQVAKRGQRLEQASLQEPQLVCQSHVRPVHEVSVDVGRRGVGLSSGTCGHNTHWLHNLQAVVRCGCKEPGVGVAKVTR